MDQQAPFVIGAQGVTILSDPQSFRERFAKLPAIGISSALEPAFCQRMVQRAATAQYSLYDGADQVGTRLVETPPLIGKALSLLLHAPELLRWLELATGVGPLNAAAGHFAEFRANQSDSLHWHDDLNDSRRRLAVVINLSDQPFAGGQFQLRRKGETDPLMTYDHPGPGSMLLVAVRPELEHCVTPVNHGGPRRTYAGWFMTGGESPSQG